MSTIDKRLKSIQAKGLLTISDLACFTQIDRSTVNNWIRGTPPRDRWIPLVEGELVRIDKAIDMGYFPMPLTITQFERKDYVKEVRDAIIRGVRPKGIAAGQLGRRGSYKSNNRGDNS